MGTTIARIVLVQNRMSLRAAANVVLKIARRERLPAESFLLSHEKFDKYVKLRSMGFCVFCESLAIGSYHVLDRKLFQDGGYYLGNGAALCNKHHRRAEATLISVEEVRTRARISEPVLPAGFDPAKVYDKWGNQIINSEIILLGPLKLDTSCRKALIAGQKAQFLYDVLPFMIDEI